MRLDKCRSAHRQGLAFSTLLWLPTCSLSEPEKWGMVSPEGLRELGFRSVITSLRGGRRSNHRLTGAREMHPWSGRGVVVVVLKPSGPQMPASIQSCSVHSVQSLGGGVLGYRQPRRHTDFREVWGNPGLEAQLQSSLPSVVWSTAWLSLTSISPAVKCEVTWPSPWTDFTELQLPPPSLLCFLTPLRPGPSPHFLSSAPV